MLAALSEANKQLLSRWFEEVWNHQDKAAIGRMLHPQCKVHGLTETGDPLEGPAGFEGFHTSFRGAFPDIHVDIEDIVAEGDKVAIRWKATMTHLGDHLGFPASGKKAELTGSTFAIVKGNQIVEGWNEMDRQALLQKLKTP
jgi:steroid delta-isomerase-like uncharacterized protein